MKHKFYSIIILMFFAVAALSEVSAQKVGFISSDVIRDKFMEAQQAEQRIQSVVEDWKRELQSMQQRVEDLKFEIDKNRLVWSDEERINKEQQLKQLIDQREKFAKQKFEPGGEYDGVVEQIMAPVEQKIYAAVQEVASDNKYDIVWDTSVQPLVSANYKYDLTVKVLKKLGVDVEKLEEELEENIKTDPRNEKKRSRNPRRRSRTPDDDQQQVQQEQEEQQQEAEEEEEDGGDERRRIRRNRK